MRRWIGLPCSDAELAAYAARGYRATGDWITVDRDLTELPWRPSFEWAVLDCDRASHASVLREVLAELPDGEAPGALDRMRREPGVRIWRIAVRHERACGVVLGSIERFGMLQAFGLARWARGRGWGTELHRSALCLLAEHGAGRYRDQTWEGNQAMKRVFSANGCTVIRRFRELEAPGGPRARPGTSEREGVPCRSLQDP